MTEIAPILIGGEWRDADRTDTFTATSPTTTRTIDGIFPVSSWSDVNDAIHAALVASRVMRQLPGSKLARFLWKFADLIDEHSEQICKVAELETGLPYAPRLHEIELPRTTDQLRQAADAADDGAWRMPTIDAKANIRSVLEPLGPVVVFGPNNFPFAFNGISGGDFAAAIASGNPVIAKAHPLHPATSRLLAERAAEAAEATDMPPGIVQLIYAMSNEDGLRLVADRRIGAAAFTGSRVAGTALKASADAAGKPIFLEMSSVNPVVILPGALSERFDGIVTELTISGLMATGQFCTNPGVVVLVAGEETERFITAVADAYAATPCGTLLGRNVRTNLVISLQKLRSLGATMMTVDPPDSEDGFMVPNTLLRLGGNEFLASPDAMQIEAFGNATLVVVADSLSQVGAVIDALEGSLTGCIYSSTSGTDDTAYDSIATRMRPRVGRLINDKMPTGVAVSPAMNHGGPFPASGHPHFTAVGIPAALRRFTMLSCYDGVRQQRLPPILRD